MSRESRLGRLAALLLAFLPGTVGWSQDLYGPLSPYPPVLAEGTEPAPAVPEPDWAGPLAEPSTDAGVASLIGLQTEIDGESATKSEANDGLEERLKTLESAWETFQAGEDKKKAVAGKKPTFQIGGRVHLDYWGFPQTTEAIDYFENPVTGTDVENRFLFRRIRLEMQGDIFETMLWRMQVDFNIPDEPQIKDVYLGFTELPWNQEFLIGHQKRPIGLDHLNSSRFNVFLERPLIVEAFNQDARRLGAQMYGFTNDEVYHWRYGVFLQQDIQALGSSIGDSAQASLNARLSSSPWYDAPSDGRGYFHWAIAGMLARPDGDIDPVDTNVNEARFRTRSQLRTSSRWVDTLPIGGAEWYEILAFEAMANVGAWQWVAEHQTSWVQRGGGPGPDVAFHGGYSQLSYFLTGEHIPYDRRTGTIGRVVPFENFFLVDQCRGGWGHGWGAWQIATRASYIDLSDADVRGGVEHNYSLALNWYWNSHARLQTNLELGEIDRHRPVGPNGLTSGRFIGFGTRFAVDF